MAVSGQDNNVVDLVVVDVVQNAVAVCAVAVPSVDIDCDKVGSALYSSVSLLYTWQENHKMS